MKYQLLVDRITERRTALGLSERKACLNAGINVDAIRMIRKGHSPRAQTLSKLEATLRTPAGYFTDALKVVEEGNSDVPIRNVVPLSNVYVRASVRAGAWREAIEWHGDDWYPITVMADPRYPGIEAFGLEVRGNSMNRIYPEGTILVCIKFLDIGRQPEPGEKVICLRRDRHGAVEATVKEYQLDAAGRHVLWPRSDDPEFQQPIILSGEGVPLGDASVASLPVEMQDSAGIPDVWIWALVTQSVRRE